MNAPANSPVQSIPAKLTNPTIIVALAFVASRWLYCLLGVRFDKTILYYAEQFLDVNLLQERLIESIFYLHCQPPLFNLFLGSILKAFSEHLDTVFHLAYFGFGLLMAVSLVALMNRLGLPRLLSTILTVIFVASPVTVLYENWLFYVYPVASVSFVLCLGPAQVGVRAQVKIRPDLLFLFSLSMPHLEFVPASVVRSGMPDNSFCTAGYAGNP